MIGRSWKFLRASIAKKTHGTPKNVLCPECEEFLAYAMARRIRCPLDPKPKCKECPIHCYSPRMRERVRDVMRVGGMYFILRGRLDWAFKYLILARESSAPIKLHSSKK